MKNLAAMWLNCIGATLSALGLKHIAGALIGKATNLYLAECDMDDSDCYLPTPPGADEEGSKEIMRCWVCGKEGNLQVVFRSETWGRVGVWGIMLADITRHLGNALEKDFDIKYEEAVSQIFEMYVNEMNLPTDTPRLIDITSNPVERGN